MEEIKRFVDPVTTLSNDEILDIEKESENWPPWDKDKLEPLLNRVIADLKTIAERDQFFPQGAKVGLMVRQKSDIMRLSLVVAYSGIEECANIFVGRLDLDSIDHMVNAALEDIMGAHKARSERS